MTEEEELRRHRVCRRRAATIACRKNRSAPCCRRDRVSGRHAPCVVPPPPRIFQNIHTSHHTLHAPSRTPRPWRIRPSTADYIAFSSPPPTADYIAFSSPPPTSDVLNAPAHAPSGPTRTRKAIGANAAAALETSAAVAPQKAREIQKPSPRECNRRARDAILALRRTRRHPSRQKTAALPPPCPPSRKGF